MLEEPEAASAIEDYGDGDLSRVEMITVLNCYFAYTADGGLVSNPCWGPEGCWWLTATAVSQTQTAVAQPPDTPTPPAPIVTPAPPTATPTPEPTATPTPEPTDTPTPEPTDTPTPEPTDTPTPEPTAGPTPEPTAAPVPTATPTPAWPGGTLTASPSTIKVGQTFTVTGKLYAYLGQDVDIQFEDAVARPARCNDPSGSSSTRQTITEIPISVEGRGCYAGTGTVKAVVLHGNVIASTTVTVATTVVLPTPTDRTFTKDVTITPFTLLGASGGTPPYEYVVSGLPSGLSFTESTREVSGTPTATGESTVTYSVTDSANQTASVTFKITVTDPPTLPTPSDLTFTKDVAITPVALPGASGGTPPYKYTVSGLPSGLSFTESTREVSGTPTATGESTVTYSVTDSAGQTVSKTFKITVTDPPTPTPKPVGPETVHSRAATRVDCPNCTYGAILVSWSDDPAATSYRVEQTSLADNSWYEVPSTLYPVVEQGTINHDLHGKFHYRVVSGLRNGETYQYRVYAINDAGDSLPSSPTSTSLKLLLSKGHQRDNVIKYSLDFSMSHKAYNPDPRTTLPAAASLAASAWNGVSSRVAWCTGSSCLNPDGVITSVTNTRECASSAACHWKGTSGGHITSSMITMEVLDLNGDGVLDGGTVPHPEPPYEELIWWIDVKDDHLLPVRPEITIDGMVFRHFHWWDVNRVMTHEFGHTVGFPDLGQNHRGIMHNPHAYPIIGADDKGYLNQLYYRHDPH